MIKKKMKNNQAWARFRFSVIGVLFSNPPERGGLRSEFINLSEKLWTHPVSGEKIKVAHKTIEEWYYKAKKSADPVEVLRQKTRTDAGATRALTEREKQELLSQYTQHKSWTYKLHADNFNANVEKNPSVGSKRSYTTVLRFMKRTGLFKKKKIRNSHRQGVQEAERIKESREIRSYETPYVNALWHLDFHHGSKQVLTEDGQWVSPILLCILDDHSRLICHIQWFFNEDTEALIHGVVQAIQKRGLPRAILSDNGSAMVAEEYTQGLLRLSIVYETTLVYSPHQNGKQECLWGQVEGRLIAMLENQKNLNLKFLNDATQAWAEMEYNRKIHSEINMSPLESFLNSKNIGRPSLPYLDLKRAFMCEESRSQRFSDGTISVAGKRFEIPNRFRHIQRIAIRYARWDLSQVFMVDVRSSKVICQIYPVNKALNADGKRRVLDPVIFEEEKFDNEGLPPLLEKLISDYSATGLPPAYIPEDRKDK